MFSILINKVLAACCDPNTQTCLPNAVICPTAPDWGLGAGTGLGTGAGTGVSGSTSGGIGGIDNPLQFDDLTSLLVFIGEKLYLISIPIVVIMIIYGAFQILTAAGETDRIQTGKRTVWYAIIGFAVVLLAGGIASIIKSFTSN